MLIRFAACRQGPISLEAVREALLDCCKQRTHYGAAFIERIYGRLREGSKMSKQYAPHEPDEKLLSADDAFSRRRSFGTRWQAFDVERHLKRVVIELRRACLRDPGGIRTPGRIERCHVSSRR